MLDVVRSVSAISDLESYGRVVLSELASIVPFDHGTFNRVDPDNSSAQFDVFPPDVQRPAWSWAHYERYLPENPIYQYAQRTHDGSARRLSDFIELGDLHRLGLYTEVLRPLGIEYQVAVSLPARRPLVLGIGLSRARTDFSDDECDTLNTLRPHLVQAYRTAAILDSHRSVLQRILSELEVDGRGVLILNQNAGVPEGEGSFGLLDRYFGRCGTGRLPPVVADWLARERTAFASDDKSRLRQPLVGRSDGGDLVLRYIPGNADAPDIIFVDERVVERDTGALRELGLTHREADVLWYLTRGLSSSEIGLRLSISERTVRKHLEHIYRKLGVTTRAAATAQATDAFHWRGAG